MSIDVYWSMCPFRWEGAYRVEDPENISKKFLSEQPGSQFYSRCQSTQEHLKNLYGLRQIYDANFDFDIDNRSIYADDEETFNMLFIRSLENNLFSWSTGYIFFTEKDSLIMEVLPAYLEDNKIQTRPYFAGNIMLQPAYSHLMNPKDAKDNFPNATFTLTNTFFHGTSAVITPEQIAWIKKVADDFLSQYENRII